MNQQESDRRPKGYGNGLVAVTVVPVTFGYGASGGGYPQHSPHSDGWTAPTPTRQPSYMLHDEHMHINLNFKKSIILQAHIQIKIGLHCYIHFN